MAEKHDTAGFLCGCVGGALSVITTYPLDTIKVRLQLFSHYKGVGDCTRQIFVKEGFRSFFKGMAFPLLTFSAYNSIIFGSYKFFLQQICQWRYEETKQFPSLADELMAAAAAGASAAMVGGPIDLVKIRLQMQTDPVTTHLHMRKTSASSTAAKPDQSLHKTSGRHYTGPVNCAVKIYHENGIRGLYRGTGAMVLRDIPGYAIYLVPYFSLRHYLIKDIEDEHQQVIKSLLASVVAGGCAGVLSWGGIHFIDTVKTRIQADIQGKHQKYHGIFHCFKSIYQENGMNGFFRGITMNALRGFPQSAILFLGMEGTYQILRKLNKPTKDH